MKKITAVVLCLAVCMLFTGCGKKKADSTVGSTAVAKYIENGNIPECEFSLGMSKDDVLARVKETVNGEDSVGEEGEDAPEYTEYETESYYVVSTEEFNYYFGLDDGKLKCIAAFGDAYGFSHGAVITEVKNSMQKNGYTASEGTLSPQDAFFLYGNADRSKLEYTFGSNTAMFVFEDSALCATALIAG